MNKSQILNRRKNQFYQFNKLTSLQILYKLAGRPLALKIFLLLLYSANESGVVAIKQKYIKKATSMKSRSSINYAMRYLKRLNIITVKKLDVRDVYIINPYFVWQYDNRRTGFKNKIANKYSFNTNFNEFIKNNKDIYYKFNYAKDHSMPETFRKLSLNINKSDN